MNQQHSLRLTGCLLLLFFLATARALALTFPAAGFVNDFANVIDSAAKTRLEEKLVTLEKTKAIEFAVVTVKSLEGTTVEDYAVKLVETWGIGKKNENNGLLLLVAPTEHKVKFEVGYGLEPILTDAAAGRILDTYVLPSFKANDYSGGIEAGANAAADFLMGTAPLPTATPKDSKITSFLNSDNLGILFILPLLLLQYLASFLARSKSFWAGGVIGGLLGGLIGLIGKSLFLGLGVAGALGLIGLILDYFLSKNYDRLKGLGRSTGFWGSGGGFFRGGGSGFGGFGGGMSGGGGSSRSW